MFQPKKVSVLAALHITSFRGHIGVKKNTRTMDSITTGIRTISFKSLSPPILPSSTDTRLQNSLFITFSLAAQRIENNIHTTQPQLVDKLKRKPGPRRAPISATARMIPVPFATPSKAKRTYNVKFKLGVLA